MENLKAIRCSSIAIAIGVCDAKSVHENAHEMSIKDVIFCG